MRNAADSLVKCANCELWIAVIQWRMYFVLVSRPEVRETPQDRGAGLAG